MRRIIVALLLVLPALSACDREEVNPVTNGTPKGSAPPIPALATPADGAVEQDIPAPLAWSPSAGATAYDVQVARDASFTDIIFNDRGVTATAVSVSGLLAAKDYWWRVMATNAHGVSAWSTGRRFRTYTIGVPALALPANGVADQPLSIGFSWSAANHADRYWLQVSLDSAFTPSRGFVVNDSSLTGTGRAVDGLSRTSTLYWRVMARAGSNSSAWSPRWKFQTIRSCDVASVTHEGKVYETVSIRDQCWLRQNLDVGSMVGGGSILDDGGGVEKYCYDNDPAICEEHGGFYSWAEAMQYSASPGARGLCPAGWHVPTRADIATLSAAAADPGLSRYFVAPDGGGTNETGFTAHLAGYYDFGYFGEMGDVTKFWLSEQDPAGRAYYWVLGKTGYGLVWPRQDKSAGYSVRCVQD